MTKEEKNTQQREYYKKHPEKYVAYREKRKEIAPDENKDNSKRYYHEHKTEIALKRKTPEFRERESLRNTAKRHKLNIEQYLSKFDMQNGRCAICGFAGFPAGTQNVNKVEILYLDHDHITDKNREFLCHGCNMSIGYMKDNVELLRKAVIYIERHRDNKESI